MAKGKPCMKVAHKSRQAAMRASWEAYRVPRGFKSRPTAYECDQCKLRNGAPAWHWTKGLWSR